MDILFIYEIGSSYTLLPKPSIESAEKLTASLRKSIREHKDFSHDKRHNSILGASNHIAHLVFFKGLQRLGIRTKFEELAKE